MRFEDCALKAVLDGAAGAGGWGGVMPRSDWRARQVFCRPDVRFVCGGEGGGVEVGI